MKAVLSLALALVCVPTAAQAQRISGPAVAIDGDTLDMGSFRVRLFGIDAVERDQTCDRDGQAWRCGEDAHALLSQLVAGEAIACERRDTDVYGRMVGVCRAGRVDLSAAMASAGYAVALRDFSDAYLLPVDGARLRLAGIWGSEFIEPSAWRAANPRTAETTRPALLAAAPPRRAARAVEESSAVAEAGPYYRNCTEARAAGVAPLYRGQAGYRPEMDGDGDGVACEPYRGRR